MVPGSDCKECPTSPPKVMVLGVHWITEAETQYFGISLQRVDSLEKTRAAGGIRAERRRDGGIEDSWMASPAFRG